METTRECPVRQEQRRRGIWYLCLNRRLRITLFRQSSMHFASKNSDQPDGCCAAGWNRSLARTRNPYTVDSRRSSTTNSKRPWSSLCCSSTPRPGSSMSVEAELMRTQSVSTMPSPPVPFQRMLRAQTFPHASSFQQREVARWPSQGTSVGHRRPTRAACKREQEFQGTEWRRLQRPHVKTRTAQCRHPFTHSLAQSSRSRPALPRCTQPLTLAPRIRRSWCHT